MTAEDNRGSVAFDRAADIYDSTRALSAEAAAAVRDVLARELGGRDPVLEIGVGTGRIALPLVNAGVRLVGLDLSLPMLGKLVEKAVGTEPLPLVQGDATRLPFGEGAFGAAYGVHVLHLIPNWPDAVAELVRVVRPGGLVLFDLGGLGGELQELQAKLAAAAGRPVLHAGLEFDGGPQLDEAFAGHGATVRTLEPIEEMWRMPIEAFITFFKGGVFSWAWEIPEDDRERAAETVRPWAKERYGSLDEPVAMDRSITWRVYDLP